MYRGSRQRHCSPLLTPSRAGTLCCRFCFAQPNITLHATRYCMTRPSPLRASIRRSEPALIRAHFILSPCTWVEATTAPLAEPAVDVRRPLTSSPGAVWLHVALLQCQASRISIHMLPKQGTTQQHASKHKHTVYVYPLDIGRNSGCSPHFGASACHCTFERAVYQSLGAFTRI